MRKEMLKKSIGTIVMTIALVGTSIPGVTVSPVKVNADVATTVSASSNEVGKLESIFTTIDLMDASISELEMAMEKGELTAEQLVQMYIDRINAYDKSLDLNSIITINLAYFSNFVSKLIFPPLIYLIPFALQDILLEVLIDNIL